MEDVSFLITCSVCQDSLADGDNDRIVIASPVCGHVYHSNCLAQWFRRSARNQNHAQVEPDIANDQQLEGHCPICNSVFQLGFAIQLYLNTEENLDGTSLKKLETEIELKKKELTTLSSENASLKEEVGFLNNENNEMKLEKATMIKDMKLEKATMIKEIDSLKMKLIAVENEVKNTKSGMPVGPPYVVMNRVKTMNINRSNSQGSADMSQRIIRGGPVNAGNNESLSLTSKQSLASKVQTTKRNLERSMSLPKGRHSVLLAALNNGKTKLEMTNVGASGRLGLPVRRGILKTNSSYSPQKQNNTGFRPSTSYLRPVTRSQSSTDTTPDTTNRTKSRNIRQ